MELKKYLILDWIIPLIQEIDKLISSNMSIYVKVFYY